MSIRIVHEAVSKDEGSSQTLTYHGSEAWKSNIKESHSLIPTTFSNVESIY
jgi:hypothetical protein